MKKLIYLALAAFLITSCQKDPKYSDLDNEFLVYTSYDKAADFGTMSTYFIPDSILLIGNKAEPTYWKGEDANKIINTFVTNMDKRGYTRITDKDAPAALGIQLSYIQDDSYFVNYHDNGYWWWGYPGYWIPGYWGDWSNWYYPYSVVYGYSVGSLLAEAVDLQAEQGAGKKLPVVWNAFMSGLLSDDSTFNLNVALRAVDQAFTQSPYIEVK